MRLFFHVLSSSFHYPINLMKYVVLLLSFNKRKTETGTTVFPFCSDGNKLSLILPKFIHLYDRHSFKLYFWLWILFLLEQLLQHASQNEKNFAAGLGDVNDLQPYLWETTNIWSRSKIRNLRMQCMMGQMSLSG